MTDDEFRRWIDDLNRRPRIMGVLNVTPDSFSDGGKFAEAEAAVGRAMALSDAGADVIDLGGESTRPGSDPTSPDEQIRRVSPVLRRIAGKVKSLISIDTGSAAVAEAALDAGAALINDIYAGQNDPALLPLAARRGVPIVLMHMQGRPATMQRNPTYAHVVPEVIAFLRERIGVAEKAGVDPDNILIDPGIGFGKAINHNLELIRRMDEIKAGVGRPMVVGISRKGFLGKITGESLESGRPFGTAAAVAWAAAHGADLLRVHDVASMSQVVRMIEAIQNGIADV